MFCIVFIWFRCTWNMLIDRSQTTLSCTVTFCIIELLSSWSNFRRCKLFVRAPRIRRKLKLHFKMADSLLVTSGTVNDDGNDVAQTRVMLWCPPRSTSTILTKCLSFVPESQVFFEPYYNCYHSIGKLKRLGKTVSPTTYDDVTTEEWLKVANMMAGEDCREQNRPQHAEVIIFHLSTGG